MRITNAPCICLCLQVVTCPPAVREIVRAVLVLWFCGLWFCGLWFCGDKTIRSVNHVQWGCAVHCVRAVCAVHMTCALFVLCCTQDRISVVLGALLLFNLPQFSTITAVVGSLTRHSLTVLCRRVQGLGWGLYTKCACVLSCPAYDLRGGTLFCFCAPKMSSSDGLSDSGKGKMPVKRGEGQDGPKKAGYATQISPADQVAQYPDQPRQMNGCGACAAESQYHIKRRILWSATSTIRVPRKTSFCFGSACMSVLLLFVV